jgi:hypothetical protein
MSFVNVKWISWVICYAGRGPGKWTLNHLTKDQVTTLCGRAVPDDAFNVEHHHDPNHDDCKLCQKKKGEAS